MREKEGEEMSDAEWVDSLERITDPQEALRTLVENESYLGYDPYYKDLRAALMRMCERCGAGK